MFAFLRTKVPCDYRTLCFAFFMGSLFSVPIGLTPMLMYRPFDPPEWTQPIYAGAVLLSFLALPFWSGTALRSQPLLRRIGFVTFGVALFLLLLAMLFPALAV